MPAAIRARTAALLIQAGVTRPWTDAKYVPELLRGEYNTAFERFGWAGDRVSQIMFGLLVKLRESSFTDEDKVKALAGERLAEAKQDAAYKAVLARILREDATNRGGELNDALNVFFSKSEYCDWARIEAPTLLIHDEKDPFVPVVHAHEAKARISQCHAAHLRARRAHHLARSRGAPHARGEDAFPEAGFLSFQPANDLFTLK